MKQSISFGWKFLPGFSDAYVQNPLPSSASLVDIPHAPVIEPINYFDEKNYQGLFSYEKTFDAPEGAAVVLLTFEGVMLKLHPYLNGVDLGEKVSGWVPVSYDITSALKAKNNRLLVVVDGREDPHVPPFGRVVDYLTFAGIYRPVYLESKPLPYFSSLHVEGNKEGRLHLEPTLVGDSKGSTLTYRLSYGGRLIKEFSSNDVMIPNPELWDLDHPCLYELTASLASESGVDTRTIRFGFRDARFTPHGFFLNGKKVKLVGLNRHQNYPYVGPAMPSSAQKEDAEILKMKIGCNLVRTSHYPDSEDFLSRCDELGLLVVDEVPGWQYIGKDAAWRANFQFFIEAMVEKERNHPCLIAYGTRIDESPDDDELYSKAVDYVHKINPTRQCLGVRNFKTSHCLEDVYGYNDFSCGSLDHGLDDPKNTKGGRGKPILISEHNGHMFPTKQFDEPSKRLEHALRHLRVLDDAYKYSDLCGAVGWCAFDYNTHQDFGSGDHICYHGVSDIFRNPKAAAFAYASQSSRLPVMWIANPPVSGEYNECLTKPIYIFTNCDYVELYKNDQFVEVFKPDRKDFPHLPHPPIVVNDFVGALANQEGWSKGDTEKLRRAMNYFGQVGIAHAQLSKVLFFLPVLLRHHLSTAELSSLFNKYMGANEKAMVYTFRGYREGKEVCLKKDGPSTHFSYRFDVSNQHLMNADTYDVARVAIKLVDEWGSQMHYTHNILSFETHGPIQVLGPSQVALQGGDIAVYVRSLATKTNVEARLIIHTDAGDYPIDFTVE